MKDTTKESYQTDKKLNSSALFIGFIVSHFWWIVLGIKALFSNLDLIDPWFYLGFTGLPLLPLFFYAYVFSNKSIGPRVNEWAATLLIVALLGALYVYVRLFEAGIV